MKLSTAMLILLALVSTAHASQKNRPSSQAHSLHEQVRQTYTHLAATPAKRKLMARQIVHAAARFGNDITSAATVHGIRPTLVLAVIIAESGGNPNAISSKGAHGLMQIQRPGYTTPEGNIQEGTRMLAQGVRQYSTLPLALAWYNGPANLRWSGDELLITPDGERYAARVLAIEAAVRKVVDEGEVPAPEDERVAFNE